MALVLCTGNDKALMNTRKLLLESSGHRVITALTAKAAQDACEHHAIDVVVIGQAMHDQHKTTIFDLVRKLRPQAKVLELHDPFQKPGLPTADDWLAVPSDVPSELAEHVSLLGRQQPRKGPGNVSRRAR